ncbi:MAG: hypothetical protein ACYTGZ_16340 [Planctomycetota bacterium]|jgi:hypothetical protein
MNEHVLTRHAEVWSERSGQIRRWAIATVLFGWLLLARVIEPHVEISSEVNALLPELSKVQADLERETATLKQADRLARDLERVYRTVWDRSPPWSQSMDALKRQLQNLGSAYRKLAPAEPADVIKDLKMASRDEGAGMADQTAPRRRRRTPTDPLGSRPNTLASAAAALRITSEELSGLRGGAAFGELLSARVVEEAGRRADATVETIDKQIRTKVLDPLNGLVGAESGERLKGLVRAIGKEVETLAEAVAKWRAALLDDPDWYRTAVQKDDKLKKLNDALSAYRENAEKHIDGERSKLDAQVNRLRSSSKETGAEVEAKNERLDGLRGVLDQTLPPWLSGFVSAPVLVQAYPIALLGLVAVLAVMAWRVRSQFVIVRGEIYTDGRSRDDPSLSSVWTLVRRGTAGTFATAVLYVGGAALLWWLFESGCSNALAWVPVPDQEGEPWGGGESIVSAARPLGRVVFAAAVLGACAALARDWRGGSVR